MTKRYLITCDHYYPSQDFWIKEACRCNASTLKSAKAVITNLRKQFPDDKNYKVWDTDADEPTCVHEEE